MLRTAARLFNTNGFHATKIDDVAALLNVTKPTIYHYFANKDEILFECVRVGLQSVELAVAGAQGRSGAERLRAMLVGYALAMTEDFGICVTRTGDAELSPESRSRFRALKREIDLMVRAVVEEGMADGSLRRGDARLVTFTLSGALNWIARWYNPAAGMSAQDVAEGVVNTLMVGVIAQGEN